MSRPRRRSRATGRRLVGPATPVTSDHGAATIEFVFLGLLVLIPLLYLVIAVFEVQRNAFAVTQAAREAGRAVATADDPATAEARARYAMRLALSDQGIDGDAVLTFVPVGADCAAGGGLTLEPGAEFEVCVVREFRVPGVPSILDGGNNTVAGRYLVHVDDFRGGDG